MSNQSEPLVWRRMRPLWEESSPLMYDPPPEVSSPSAYSAPHLLQDAVKNLATPWELLDRLTGNYEDYPDNDVEDAIFLLESLGYTVTPPCT